MKLNNKKITRPKRSRFLVLTPTASKIKESSYTYSLKVGVMLFFKEFFVCSQSGDQLVKKTIDNHH
jgi:hypothetical protein